MFIRTGGIRYSSPQPLPPRAATAVALLHRNFLFGSQTAPIIPPVLLFAASVKRFSYSHTTVFELSPKTGPPPTVRDLMSPGATGSRSASPPQQGFRASERWVVAKPVPVELDARQQLQLSGGAQGRGIFPRFNTPVKRGARYDPTRHFDFLRPFRCVAASTCRAITRLSPLKQ